MAELIYGQEDNLLPWAQDRIGVSFRRDAYTIGLERSSRLVAVVVFDNFTDGDCNMHIASDGTSAWLTKSFLAAAFAYPFTQLGLRRVTGMVPADNEAALRFDTHLGFEREGYHPQAGQDGRDLISLGMLKSACRFIPRCNP